MLGEKKYKHLVSGLLCLASFFAATLVHADVAIGTQKIATGTEIKVLEPGPDLQDIIDGITDEGPNKPYVIKLGPGVFDIQPDPDTGAGLVMKPWISIVGSGQGVTILRGAISTLNTSTSAIVTGASNTLLASLSVENTGGSSLSIAVYNNGADPRIERVSATASGGSVGYGVYNTGSSPAMTAVTANGSGAVTSYGVYNSASFATMTEVTAAAAGGSMFNYGVYNTGSSPTMNRVTATASDEGASFSVYNSGSSPAMNGVTATGADFGIFNASASSSPRIRNSYLVGVANAMEFNGSTGTRISNSQLVGGIDADPDPLSNQCRNTFDENLGNVPC